MQYDSNSYKFPNQKFQVPAIVAEPAQSDAGVYYDSQEVQNLAIMSGAASSEAFESYNFPLDLDSEPPIPEDYYDVEPFNDLLSSPPNSPSRNPPLPQYPTSQMDFRTYQQMQAMSSPDFYSDFEPPMSETGMPFRQPIHYQKMPLPNTLYAPNFPSNIPDLSPALSEPQLDSPPLENGFQWQHPGYQVTPKMEPLDQLPSIDEIPSSVNTIPSSVDNIPSSLDDQYASPQLPSSPVADHGKNRPKPKRKTCLPEGVVEEYVGHSKDSSDFVCLYPNCQRIFKRSHNLRSHIQTHLCDRPYICSICGSRFVRPHDMRRHERGHNAEKPYTCPCGRAFGRQDAMMRHRMRKICLGTLTKEPGSPRGKGIHKSPMVSMKSPKPSLKDAESPVFHATSNTNSASLLGGQKSASSAIGGSDLGGKSTSIHSNDGNSDANAGDDTLIESHLAPSRGLMIKHE